MEINYVIGWNHANNLLEEKSSICETREQTVENFCNFYVSKTGRKPVPEEILLFLELEKSSKQKETAKNDSGFTLLEELLNLEDFGESLFTSIKESLDSHKIQLQNIMLIKNSREEISPELIDALLQEIKYSESEREHLHSQYDKLNQSIEEFFSKSRYAENLNELFSEIHKKIQILENLKTSLYSVMENLREIEDEIGIVKNEIIDLEKEYSCKKSQSESIYVDFSSKELLIKVKTFKEELEKNYQLLLKESTEFQNLKILHSQHNIKMNELNKMKSSHEQHIKDIEAFKKEVISELFKKREHIFSKLIISRHLVNELKNLKEQEKVLLSEFENAKLHLGSLEKEYNNFEGDNYFSVEKSFNIAKENYISIASLLKKVQENIAERESSQCIQLNNRLEEELNTIERHIKNEEDSLQLKLLETFSEESEEIKLEKEISSLQGFISASSESIEDKEKKISSLSREILKIRSELVERFYEFSSLPLETIRESLEIVLSAEDMKFNLDEDMLMIDEKIKFCAGNLLSLIQNHSLILKELSSKETAVNFLENDILTLEEEFEASLENSGFSDLRSISNWLFSESSKIYNIIQNKNAVMKKIDESSEELGMLKERASQLMKEFQKNQEFEQHIQLISRNIHFYETFAEIFNNRDFIKFLALQKI